MVVIEHTNQLDAQVFDVAGAGGDRGFVDAARRAQLQVAEVGFFAGAGVRTGYVQTGLFGHRVLLTLSVSGDLAVFAQVGISDDAASEFVGDLVGRSSRLLRLLEDLGQSFGNPTDL